ncbi:hypothetical protein F5X99DRAFT_395228, partial [Biscogniauxia marginata]
MSRIIPRTLDHQATSVGERAIPASDEKPTQLDGTIQHIPPDNVYVLRAGPRPATNQSRANYHTVFMALKADMHWLIQYTTHCSDHAWKAIGWTESDCAAYRILMEVQAGLRMAQAARLYSVYRPWQPKKKEKK